MKQFSLFWMKSEWSHSVTNDLFFFLFQFFFMYLVFYFYYFYYCVNCVCFHLKCNWNSHNREKQKQKQWTLSTFSVMSSPRGFVFCFLLFLLYSIVFLLLFFSMPFCCFYLQILGDFFPVEYYNKLLIFSRFYFLKEIRYCISRDVMSKTKYRFEIKKI